ncbi:hypothetical protein GII36_03725 [Candidatus Mycosynbacter amalyticus]|uniref:Uncharacterized protein n=1 Tax=Candidatus Mycosynbacter amalyticus TaxID=2665156 RepID=A0A857MLH4_9BACT|nr:hypothetical protein [Candidatus Mycosynbacter amalyticus]QHN42948.1 hypothetical protein GII36_03725 [Candidatus Mycosynbacter amalyticus]
MTNLSWNEIQGRATEFASKLQGETYEADNNSCEYAAAWGLMGYMTRAAVHDIQASMLAAPVSKWRDKRESLK